MPERSQHRLPRAARSRFARPLACLIAFLLCAPSAAEATFFLVNSTGDDPDDFSSDGLCSTGNTIEVTPGNNQPECTLRAAIQQAEGLPGTDTITFASTLPVSPSGYVFISPATPLPALTDPLIIDGYSAPGFDLLAPFATPVIQLNGASLSSGDGLQILTSEGHQIRGLSIHNFPGSGIHISGGDVTIEGSHIGVQSGILMRGNGEHGIHVVASSGIVTIGRTCDAMSCTGAGNLISDNGQDGIRVEGGMVQVTGNRIGTDKNGSLTFVPFGGATPNDGWGINADFESAGFIFVGAFTESAEAGNLISGNRAGGILVVCDASGTNYGRIYGNQVGTNAAGTAALPNEGIGIRVEDAGVAAQSIVGGTSFPTQGNLVAGNQGIGILTLGELNVVGNVVGLTADRLTALPNQQDGAFIAGSGALVAGNTIAGNGANDLGLYGSDHRVIANQIGTNGLGDVIPSEGLSAVFLSASGTQIGEAGLGNLVTHDSIALLVTGTDNVIQANYFGTDALGNDLTPLGSSVVGLQSQGSGVTIGGLDGLSNGLGNVFGHLSIAVNVGSGDSQVLGNFMGTDPLDRDLGNDIAVGLFVPSATTIGAGPGADQDTVRQSGNRIAHQNSGAISTETDLTQISMRGNLFSDNNTLAPIDLNSDGPDTNDRNDADSGTNQSQNYPTFDRSETFWRPTDDTLRVRYRVDSDPSFSQYPLAIDFYLQTDLASEADLYLGSDVYSATDAQSFKDRSVSPLLPIEEGGLLRATATDADGNTSELSTQLVYVVPEAGFGFGLIAGLLGIARIGTSKRRRSDGIRNGDSFQPSAHRR